MDTIAIIGGSGFIGRHLVAELACVGDGRVKLLSRHRPRDLDAIGIGAGVEVIQGDLQAPDSLQGFFESGCTVVNLAYLRGAGERENLAATTNLLEACRSANVRRLIHCSTADVAGRVRGNVITENCLCKPVTEYSITKLKIEHAILERARGHFDTSILRPTAVFGPGGENLGKLAGDLTAGNRLRNYLKSCLFASRRMNLVHVANVVASIIFLANRTGNLGGEVFNISDDDASANNFADVERILMREFNIPDYRLPRLPVPSDVLAFLLKRLGKDNNNPRRDYSTGKLTALEFERPVRFETGLAEYAAWYRSRHPGIG